MSRFATRLLAALALLTSLPAMAGDPAICRDLESPALLMGGGDDKPLCAWFDAPAVLVVNTASKCGFTPQFEKLEALNKRYGDRGLAILGFPSDNFMGQEYDEAEKTAEVCYVNYGVTFPMFSKVDVKGDAAHPLFRRLAEQTRAPGWNFHKYLITAEGVRDFKSSVEPDDPAIIEAVEAALTERTARAD